MNKPPTYNMVMVRIHNGQGSRSSVGAPGGMCFDAAWEGSFYLEVVYNHGP